MVNFMLNHWLGGQQCSWKLYITYGASFRKRFPDYPRYCVEGRQRKVLLFWRKKTGRRTAVPITIFTNIFTVDKFLTGNGILNPGDREEDDQSSEWWSLPRHHNPLHQRGRQIILDKFLFSNCTINLVLSFLKNCVDTITCTGLWLCCSQRLCQVWGGDHDEVSWGRMGQVHCPGQPPSKCFFR